MDCENVEDFKNLISEEEEYPSINLWVPTQTFWVHPNIFKILDANSPQRAGELVMKMMGEMDSRSLDHMLARTKPALPHDLSVGGQKPPHGKSDHYRCPYLQAL
jgi:hypothetical protein